MPVILRPPWYLPERAATPESEYLCRRDFLRLGGGIAAALAFGGALAGDLGCAEANKLPVPGKHLSRGAKRNLRYTLDRPITDEQVVLRYNNFYEFSEDKEEAAPLAQKLTVAPWQIEITGLVKSPKKLDVTDLVHKMKLEERLYRHRCVEAWAMAVPWIGFPLKALVDFAEPLSSARWIRFVSFLRPEEAPLQKRATWYPWPYFEGVTINEATSELAFVAVGLYGHDLPKQNGAPLRIVMPWKYGYKSPKSIVKVEFVDAQPATFWNTLAPSEYGFLSNVDPAVPHPRWSQASERMIGTSERRPTLPYNGYGELVAHLYRK